MNFDKSYRKAMLGIFKKFVFTICGIIFSLVLLEIGLRVVAFTSVTLKEARNTIGLLNKDTYRIMCLGESTTACSDYPQILEEYLNKKRTDKKFTVFNKGVTSVDSSYILEHLERNLEGCRPNLVVVMMGINDWKIKFYEDIPDSDSFLFNKVRLYRLFKIMLSCISNKLKKENTNYLNNRKENFIKDARSLDIGTYYLKLGNFKKAEGYFKKAIEEDPNENEAYRQLEICYRNQGGHYEENIALLKRAIVLNPKNCKAYTQLGFAFICIEKYDEAIETLEKAIALNPKDQEAYLGLARTYNYKGDFTKAEKILLKLVDNGMDVQIYHELGWSYINQNKFKNVDGLFKKAMESHPSDSTIYGIFSVLYGIMGRFDDSELLHNKANGERTTHFNPITIINYQKLKKILDKRNIRLVCVQYPMCDIVSLKNIFSKQDDVLFVDNENAFKDAIKRGNYKEYFSDTFGGNFGHCTRKGDRILAENVADVIFKNVLSKQGPQHLVNNSANNKER